MRFVPAADPAAPLTLISPRREKREYSVDAAHGKLWVLTNDDHVNFRLAEADPAAPGDWKTVIAGSDRVYLRGHSSYRDHLAISQRVDGLDQLVLRKYSGEETRIPFGEASYSAGFGGNPEFAPAAYRLVYSSMVTPLTVYDYHPQAGELETLKVQEIPSGYDPSLYRTERLMVPARDGKQVPVSVVYPRGYREGRRGQAVPLRLRRLRHGGSAELRGRQGSACSTAAGPMPSPTSAAATISATTGSCRASFNSAPTRFNDFVDVAQGLIGQGFTKAGNIAIEGRSAGGELMGAVANSDPELWGAIIAGVPFVDVLNTMLDDTLPLTPGEWPEWGNPITDKAAFDLIRSYSPYDNVTAQALSADADHRRAQRPARDLLGAGEMGRPAARHQDRRQFVAAEDRNGRWPWRQVRPLGPSPGSRRGLCLRPDHRTAAPSPASGRGSGVRVLAPIGKTNPTRETPETGFD